MTLRRALALGAAFLLGTAGAATAALAPVEVASATPTGTLPPGPFATILMSRTEITAADGCQPSDSGVARLDTTVAPYLSSLGLAGTGTLVTGRTLDTRTTCTHSGASLTASWAQASALATSHGWHFVSHTATYPGNLAGLSSAQATAETCGSAQTLDAHGLPGGHGMIAYPGAQKLPAALQKAYSSTCFAWGRRYVASGTTTTTDAAKSPFWQHTLGLDGGACNDTTAACSTVVSRRYTLPSAVIATVNALGPGQWFTLEGFVLVTGVNPAYTTSPVRWDCTSADPAQHWSNDNERYCYCDWQQIVAAIAGVPGITVTDPLTVGIAFGRPSTYPTP